MAQVVRRELALWAELMGIAVVAVTQPVLDVLGKSPDQFVFRGASSTEIVLLAVLVAAGPATLLWLPGVLSRRLTTRVGQIIHLLAVAAGVFLGAMQVLHAVGFDGAVKAAVAVVAAVGAVALFLHLEAARTWAQVMSLFSVVFLALFLFGTPAGDLVFADPPEVIDLDALVDAERAEGIDVATPDGYPDIVMIVLDELPTSLLLDESGAIDELRYPAIAEFAADATWYRSYTTVSSQTVKAIPAILSGQLPVAEDLGAWTQRPDTLFRLLGGTYHLTVSEALTRFCPTQWCGTTPVPPPAATESADDSPSVRSPTSAASTTPTFERGGLSALISDTVDVWTTQVALDRDDSPVLSGFEETVFQPPPPSTTSMPTTTADAPTIDAPSLDNDEVSGIEQDVADDFLGFRNDIGSQLPRLDAFRAAVTLSDEPTLYFLHVVLPHQPWIFTERGDLYEGPSVGADDRAEWDAILDTERMSLQTQFSDGLVGAVLDQARDAGVYDDAMVIVMADHGASAGAETEFRWFDGTNAPDLMVTPLLIKMPGQVAGGVDDVPAQSVDLLPTIADALGVEVPWETDGQPFREIEEVGDLGCEDPLDFLRFGRGQVANPDLVEHFEFCAADVIPAGLEPTLTDRRSDDEWAVAPVARRTPYPDLLGVSWAQLESSESSGRFTLDEPDQAGGGTTPHGVIHGVIDGGSDAEWVAVAIDGRVAGISPVYARPGDGEGAPTHFAILVPSPLLATAYDVRVATLEGTVDAPVATELTPG